MPLAHLDAILYLCFKMFNEKTCYPLWGTAVFFISLCNMDNRAVFLSKIMLFSLPLEELSKWPFTMQQRKKCISPPTPAFG